MKSLELKRKESALKAEREALAFKEGELNETEKTRWDSLETEIAALGKDVKRAESMEEIARQKAEQEGRQVSRNDEKDLRKFSFVRAIQGAILGRLDGLEKEMHEEDRKSVV